jgi:hypothetical protein
MKIMEKKSTQKIVLILGIVIVMLVIFKAGVYVGYRKAGFSRGLGDSYFRNFGGSPRGGMMRDDIPGGHGVTGKVIKVTPTSLIVEGSDNIEKIITINSETLVRKFRDTASTTALQVNDNVIVIGTPGSNGDVTARLIRILPQEINETTSTITK